MPMTVEMCANCGCSEFAHHHEEDEDDPWEAGTWSCECEGCSELVFIDDPDALVCICGCPGDGHEPYEEGGCLEHEHCSSFEENGTVLERVRGEVGERSGRSPQITSMPEKVGTELQVDWLDEPVTVVAALIDQDGQIVRTDEPPQAGANVFVYLAVTADGLEIAVSSHELVG